MATASPTSLINAISQVLVEELSGGVKESLPGLDDFYLKLRDTAMGVTREGLGRDFKFIQTFVEGVAGTVKWVSTDASLGSDPLSDLTHITAPVTADAYPGIAENINPGFFQKTITLARAKGNVFAPVEFMKADALANDTMIARYIKLLLLKNAENLALAEIHPFYGISSSGTKGIAIIKNKTISNNRGTNDQVVFTVAEGSIRNFYSGLLIEFTNPGGARRNASPVVVDGVRYVPDTTNDTGGWGEVTARSIAASAEELASAGVADNDVVSRWDSTGNGPLGPNDWLIITGTIFGINVATYQQHQSILHTASGPLTGLLLSKLFARFDKSHGKNNLPDTLLTSQGVINAMFENSDGLGRFMRQGTPLLLSEGNKFGRPPFQYGSLEVDIMSTSFMPSASDITAATQTGGIAWAMKTRGQNIQRYLPPRNPFAGSAEPYPQEVEFTYPITGPQGAFAAVRVSDNLTNFMQAPYDHWVAIVPTFIPGIKLTSLTESS